jgi:hypothetical protein
MIGATGAQGEKGLTGAQGVAGNQGNIGTQPGGAAPGSAEDVVFINSSGTAPTGEAAFNYDESANTLDIDNIEVSDDGTVIGGSPPYAFTSDPDTGFGNANGDPNVVSFMAGGSEIWRSDGSTSPPTVNPMDDYQFIPPKAGVDNLSNGGVINPTEMGKYLVNINAGAIAVALKDGLPIGSQFSVVQGGTGVLTISRSGTETINGAAGVSLATQYASAGFYKATSSAWYAIGAVT